MPKQVFTLNIEDADAGRSNNKLASRNGAKYKTLHFPMGLGLVLGALTTKPEYKHTVLDNFVDNTSFDSIVKEAERAAPDYILVSGFLGNYQYGFLKRAFNLLKQASPNSKLIVGGPMASCIPELLIEKTLVDVAVIGEGEDTIIDLLARLDSNSSIANCEGIVWRSEDGRAIRNPIRPRMKDLGKYPPPPYDMFKTRLYAEYLKETNRCWEISTSRGCYARCNYCRLTFGQKISFRPFNHLFEEMRVVIDQYGVNRFNFVDDNFLNSPRQVLEFVAALKSFEHKIEFRFQGRADRLTPALAKELRDVGCFDVSMGIESGSTKILEEMDKRLDLETALSNIAGTLDTGVTIHATFIVGMPSESPDTIADTLRFIEKSQIPFVSAGILTPFPDTGLYTLAKSRGLIVDDDLYCEGLGPVYEIPYVNLTQYSNEQLFAWRDQIDSYSKKSEMILDSGFSQTQSEKSTALPTQQHA